MSRSMATLLDHKTTLAYLAYLGYNETPQTSALLVTQPRRKDRKKGKVTRNVFLCYVCGAAGSGKTSLLREFIGKPYRKSYEPTTKMISVVNTVDIDGSEKYLVVRNMHISRSSCCMLTRISFSFTNLVRNTKQKLYEHLKRRTFPTSLSMCTTPAIPIHFPI